MNRQKMEEEITKIVWSELCNSCDCENYPECPEGTDGCISSDIAKAITSYINSKELKELEGLKVVIRRIGGYSRLYERGYNDCAKKVNDKIDELKQQRI